MHSLLRRAVVFLGAALAALGAYGELAIAGRIYDDQAALALRSDFVPAAGVTVKLYRDDGDRSPSAGDVAVASTKSDANGLYAFHKLAAGDYWVAVDSRTIGPAGSWPEETVGPGGSLCASPDGGTRTTYFEGPCFSGVSASRSDDASSLPTSEHIALITLGKESAARVDFAFSFNAVTSVDDGDGIQGSFRRFVTNANLVAGPNHMRFVPIIPAEIQRNPIVGVPPRWWTISLASPLPALTDAETIIDGAAHLSLSPATESDVNPGRLGEPPVLKPGEPRIPRIDKPELEVILSGAEGIVCQQSCVVERVAISGADTNLVAHADARLDHVMIGASPDGEPTPTGGITGVEIDKGTTTARFVLVTGESQAGMIVGHDARLDGERLEIHRCGAPQTGGGIILLSDGSSIRSSLVTANSGVGILLGSLDGSTRTQANLIDHCTVSSNQVGVLLAPNVSHNVISHNDIMWNRFGGVTVAPYESSPPIENRINANRFDENGLRPIVLELGVEDPNALAWATNDCKRSASLPNNGISSPRLTNVEVKVEEGTAEATIRGEACPGEVVELYQSFVTSGVREEKAADLPLIRNDKTQARETITDQERERALPSIGEFNYLGTANTAADGSFEVTFPIPIVRPGTTRTGTQYEESSIWASQVLPGADPTDRAFSGIAIDPAGNTSEMSVRRRVD